MSDAVVKIGYSDSELQSGLARSAAGVKRFASQTQSSLGAIGSTLRGGLGLLGIGAGLAGAKALLDDLDRVGDLAHQLNTSAEAVQKIGMMGKLAGTDVETVAKALYKVNVQLTTAEGKKAFRDLGIDIAKFKGLDADKQLILLASAFQQAEAKGRGTAEGNSLMSKSLKEMLPLLRSDITELKEMANIDVISNEDIERVQKLNDEFDKLSKKTVVKGETATLGLVEMFKKAKDYVLGGGDMLPSEFADQQENKRLSEEGMKQGDDASKDNVRRKNREKQDKENELNDLREELRKQREQTADQEDETVDKLSRAREKVRDFDDKLSEANKTGDEAEILRITTEREKALRSMLAIEKQYKKEIEDQAKDEKARLDTMTQFSAQLQAERLRSQGKTKEADALEKEIKLRDQAARLSKETGISEGEALKLVREKSSLEEKAEQRAHRVRGHVRGYHQEDNKYTDTFRNLNAMNGYHDAIKPKTPGLDEFHRLNSLVRNPDGRMVRPYAFPVKVKTDKAAETANRSLESIMREVANNTSELKGK